METSTPIAVSGSILVTPVGPVERGQPFHGKVVSIGPSRPSEGRRPDPDTSQFRKGDIIAYTESDSYRTEEFVHEGRRYAKVQTWQVVAILSREG